MHYLSTNYLSLIVKQYRSQFPEITHCTYYVSMRLLFYGDPPRLIASLTHIDTKYTTHIHTRIRVHIYTKSQTHIQLLIKHCNEDSGDVSEGGI